MSLSALGEQALWYAALGWPVFPLRPRRKEPLPGLHWDREATTDPEQIHKWWTRVPAANIGIVTGVKSGLVVIDCDSPEAYARFCTAYGDHDTPASITGRGRHVLFQHPGETLANSVGKKLGEGNDVRGDGGYIVAPPSVHPTGQPYRWDSAHHPLLVDPAPLPPRLLAALRATPAASTAPDGEPMAARDIASLAEIPETQRNDTLTRYAGRLLAKGHSETETLDVVRAFNTAKCKPPLGDAEVRRIAHSIASRERNKMLGDAEPITRCMSEIQPEDVQWLAPGRIPLGKLTILEGDPGLGKSTVLLDLAARLTRGEGLPGDPPITPADVILLTAEDGLADTVRPRLEAARADCSRVHTLEGYKRSDGGEGEIVLGDPNNPRSMEVLGRLIRTTDARLVIVDVFTAYLSGARDSYRDHDIRRALRPLSAVAERTGCAMVCVRHLKKNAGGKAINAGGGSVAIGGAARSVLLVDRDPADAERRVLASVKCNLAPPPASLVFRLVSSPSGASSVEWLGTSDQTADSLTEARADDQGAGSRPKIDECAAWLRDALAPGAMDRKDVLQLGRANSFPERMVERAARRIGAVLNRTGFGKAMHSEWSLPAVPTPDASSDSFSIVSGMSELEGVVGTGAAQWDEILAPEEPALAPAGVLG